MNSNKNRAPAIEKLTRIKKGKASGNSFGGVYAEKESKFENGRVREALNAFYFEIKRVNGGLKNQKTQGAEDIVRESCAQVSKNELNVNRNLRLNWTKSIIQLKNRCFEEGIIVFDETPVRDFSEIAKRVEESALKNGAVSYTIDLVAIVPDMQIAKARKNIIFAKRKKADDFKTIANKLNSLNTTVPSYTRHDRNSPTAVLVSSSLKHKKCEYTFTLTAGNIMGKNGDIFCDMAIALKGDSLGFTNIAKLNIRKDGALDWAVKKLERLFATMRHTLPHGFEEKASIYPVIYRSL